MNIKDLADMIGTKCLLQVEGTLLIPVRVNDVKQAYGQDRAHISTVNGAGTKWVSVDRLVREHVALETHGEVITRTSR